MDRSLDDVPGDKESGLTRICLLFAGDGPGTGTVWFDDLRLEEVTMLAWLPRLTRPAAIVLAGVSLILYLCSRWRQRWGKLGWKWPLGSPTLPTEATASGCQPNIRSRSRRLGEPRASESPLVDSDRARPTHSHPETAPGPLVLKGSSVGAATATVHPDAAILALFAAGRLRSSEMERIGEHVGGCSVCLDVLERIPEDSIVQLLRDRGHRIDGSLVELDAGEDGGEDSGDFERQEPISSDVPSDPVSVGPPTPVVDDVGRRQAAPIENPRYPLRTLLGRGGMGLIYLADDQVENRPVVLKFLREDLLDRPRLVERFRREAAAATQLKHPNIVEAYGTEPFGRWPALVMEYVRGTDLARLDEKAGPVPVRVACRLIHQAALGLHYSFERGMVHRDIKPSNLMLGVDGTVKILDFGLARMQSELSVNAGLTSTGAILGSVDYMATEQADDPRLADIRADIYSLGCTFYHLLSGAPPFHGMTFEIFGAHQNIEAAPLDERRPDVPAALAVLVAKMMAKEPAQRFQTPGEVAQAFLPFLKEDVQAFAPPGPATRRFDHPVPDPGATDGVEPHSAAASITSPPGSKPRRRWRRALVGAVGLVAAMLAGAGAYRWTTLKAELVIETDVWNGELLVTRAGKRVATVLIGPNKRIELDPGRYDLALPLGAFDLRISTETLALRPGDRAVVSVRRVPAQPDESIAIYLKWIDRVPARVELVFTPQDVNAAPGIPVDALYDRRPREYKSTLGVKQAFSYMLGFDSQTGTSYQSAATRCQLGTLLARHGWTELAIPVFELAIEAQRDHADAIFNLGVVLRTQKLLPDAILNFREAVRVQPKAADAHMALGLSLAETSTR